MQFKSKYFSFLVFTLFAGEALCAEGKSPNAKQLDREFARIAGMEIAEASQSYLMTRADALPIENFEDATDPFYEGYIQALIDIHYTEFQVLVSVKDHKVYLSNLPKNALISKSIISFVEDVPGVKSVEVENKFTDKELKAREIYVEKPYISGIWFPQSTVLFQPLVANPRQVVYSAAYRFGDRVIGDSVAAVSFGDIFPVYRWKGIFCWCGDLQLDIEGAVWAVFNFEDIPENKKYETCELVNADYYLGIPLSYAFDAWSFKTRVYHISSHLGDEVMVNCPFLYCDRRNPSFEAIDFFTSYQASRGVRIYFGPGWIFHSDQSFPLKPFYVWYGTELRYFGQKLSYHRLYGTPFLAIDIENWQQHDWNFDIFIKAGYELSKLQGIGRKMRAYVDYHYGYSFEGQFFNCRTSYGEIGFSWGF